MNTSYIDPTDIYCRLRPRQARRTARHYLRNLAREYAAYRKHGFGALGECIVAACLVFAALVAVGRAFA